MVARQAAAWRTVTAGTTALPIASLYGAAAGGLWLVEVIVTNTTATAVSMALRRLTTTGTQGAAQTVTYEENDSGFTARGDPRDSHTVAPTITAGSVRNSVLGASIGSGVAFTFGGRGLWIPASASIGVGLVPLTG